MAATTGIGTYRMRERGTPSPVELRLPHPPTVDWMPDHAASAVAAAARVDGVELDYSVESLDDVDRILGRFHDEGLVSTSIRETVFVFGAYIGAVISRQADGRWVDLPDDHPLGGSWPMVEIRDGGRIVNPVRRAFKRVDSGPVESVSYFYAALVAE